MVEGLIVRRQHKMGLFGPRKYIYLSVIFGRGGKTYAYRTEDRSIKVYDIVMVPVSGEPDKPAVVVGVQVCTEKDAPYPLSKTKMITGKLMVRPVKKQPQKDELGWIDELEMLDALFND